MAYWGPDIGRATVLRLSLYTPLAALRAKDCLTDLCINSIHLVYSPDRLHGLIPAASRLAPPSALETCNIVNFTKSTMCGTVNH